MATLNGDDNSNSLTGGPGDDTLNGLGGNDILEGREGSDTLNGGTGNDLISVGTGDNANGGTGNDTFELTENRPAWIDGGTGTDVLLASESNISGSVLIGLEFLGASDTSLTAAQLDSFTVVGGSFVGDYRGSVNLTQGGTATVDLDNDLGFFRLTGSGQADVITFLATDRVSLDVSAGGGDDRIVGAALYDSLDGGLGNDWLDGVGGDDTLIGGGGRDTLFGGTGDDRLIAGAGAIVYGGGGHDALFIDEGAPATLYGGSGADTLFLSSGDDITGSSLVGIETLYTLGGRLTAAQLDSFGEVGSAEEGIATLTLTRGGTADVHINGQISEFRLVGSTQADAITFNPDSHAELVVHAGAGDDYMIFGGMGFLDKLYGEAGNDTLQGGEGVNGLIGGDGSDTVSYADSVEGVTVDLRITRSQNTSEAARDTLISIESLIGSGGNDSLTGSDAGNTIEGGGGNDLITGLNGTDTASYVGAGAAVAVSLALTGAQNTGGAGLDTLSSIENLRGSAFGDALTGDDEANRLLGMAGADNLTGGAGADALVGGADVDRLEGGAGADLFEFNLTSESRIGATDVIAGFDGAGAAAGDRIDLSGIDANTAIAGNNAFVFDSVAEGGVSVGASGSHTVIRGNIDTNADFEFTLLISDDATLASAYTAADFVL